jgi:putative transposase
MLAATDFFTVEIWRPVGLVRYHVLFFMQVATRRVHIGGIIHEPYSEWMEQVARNVTDAVEGFLLGKRYLVCDRDPLFTKTFRDILGSADLKTVPLPPRSPNLSLHAERFVLTIKSECLDRVMLFSERQLRRACTGFLAHYHEDRNHQELGNRLIDNSRLAANDGGAVVCRERWVGC